MTDLFVVEHGHGPTPLIPIHGGLGLDHTYFRRSFDALGDVARVVYHDLRGNGRSPRFTGAAVASMEAWADDVDAIRASRDIDRAVIVGHSYGGFIALHYALRHPERVRGLVILGAAATFQHGEAIVANITARAPDLVETMLTALSQPARDDAHFAEVWPQVLPLYYHRYRPEYLATFAETRYSADGYNRGSGCLATHDLRARLAEIRAPTLVITGDDDFIMPAARAGEPLAAAIPGARHVSLPGAGHFAFHEVPDAFHAELRAFLATV